MSLGFVLFRVSGPIGQLIVLGTLLLWIGAIVDSAGAKKYGWTIAVVVFNFPAAVVWFAARLIWLSLSRSPQVPKDVSLRE